MVNDRNLTDFSMLGSVKSQGKYIDAIGSSVETFDDGDCLDKGKQQP